MSQYPLVSVIVPNYNHAPYLEQRLNSIFCQTYTNYEVIILDDCSPDHGASKEVIEKYRSNNHVSHIIYNKENSGSTFKQWNKGFELAKGELVWIAESDDYCEPTFLSEIIVPFRNDDSLSFAYSNLILVDDAGARNEKQTEDYIHNIPSTTPIYEGHQFIKERMLIYNSVCNASSAVFRKEYAISISKDYQQFKASGDYLFWILLAEKGNVAKIDLPLDYFRQHGTNVTSRSILNGTTAIENYQIIKYLKKQGFYKGKEGFRRFLYLLEKQLYNEQYTIEVKRNVLKVWNPYHLFNKFTMALCWRLVK